MNWIKDARLTIAVLDPRPIEIDIAAYKLLWGLIAVNPWYDPFKTAPLLYLPYAPFSAIRWGAVFLLFAVLQLWASWISGNLLFRRCVTLPTFTIFFVIWLRYITAAIQHPVLWLSFPAAFNTWAMLSTGWCVYRLCSPDHLGNGPTALESLRHAIFRRRAMEAVQCHKD